MKINWKQILSSRKLWAAVAAVVIALLVVFNVDQLKIEQTAALISSMGVLVGYICCESAIDVTRAKNPAEQPTETPTDTDIQ